MIRAVSVWAIPAFLVVVPLYGILRKVKVYESFVEGAKEGFQVGVRIIPYLVAILVAVGMLRAAGAIDSLARLLDPVLAFIGLPAEVLPLALMRPLSGSGSMGLVTELVKTHGADSFIARLAATAYGSTETTFYVLAVYFGAVAVKRARHAVLAGLTADFV
ncbi:MAG: spore maturation protein, partial [Acidobacteriota bacterium]